MNNAVTGYTVFPRIESMASIFCTHLTCGFYLRVASINASKLTIAIIINTGNSFHTTSRTCVHVDQLWKPRFTHGTSIHLFALPLGSLVLPGSPQSPRLFGWDPLSPRRSAHLVTCVWVRLKLEGGYYFVWTLCCPLRLLFEGCFYFTWTVCRRCFYSRMASIQGRLVFEEIR